MLSMLFKIGADATGVERAAAAAAGKAGKAFSSMSKEINGRLSGMFTAGAILDGAKSFMHLIADTADEVQDLSEQLELSTDDVQRLQVAADKAGVRFNVMAAAMRTVEDLRTSAATGDKKAVGIFQALGIDPSKGSALDVITAAVEAADAAGRGTAKQAALFDLLGKKAGLIRNVVLELNNLGGIRIIAPESLKAVDDANNAIKALKRDMVASSSDELGYWARVVAVGRKLEEQGKSFALTRAIFSETFGGTAGGVDLSALPIPPKDTRKKQGDVSQSTVAAIPPAPLALQSDALARIGLFVGGRGNMSEQLVTIGNYQLNELRAIRANLEHANR